MPDITDLPDSVLNLIFEYLDTRDLRSARLTNTSWNPECKRELFKVVNFDLDRDTVNKKSRAHHHFHMSDSFSHVRHLKICDAGDRTTEEPNIFRHLTDDWLPLLKGLQSILWHLSDKTESNAAHFLSALPFGVKLDLVLGRRIHVKASSDMLSTLIGSLSLRSLEIELPLTDETTLSGPLKALLLSCRHLKRLVVNTQQESTIQSTESRNTNACSLNWTPEEAASLPSLQHMVFHYPNLSRSTFALWAQHGSWHDLRSLTVHHDWELSYLIDRLPALETLTTVLQPTLSDFLDSQRIIRTLTLVADATDSIATETIHAILSKTFATNLQSFDLRLIDPSPDVERDTTERHPSLDLRSLPSFCPNLRTLTLTLSRAQYRNAVGYFCELDFLIQAILRLPNLQHLTIQLPRLIAPGTVESPPEIATLSTASSLWAQLSARGKRLISIRILASLAHEPAPTDLPDRHAAVLHALTPCSQTLTFLAQPAAKDWDAALGLHITTCPELEAAEASVRLGRITHLSSSNEYTSARRVVDDISKLAHDGVLVIKKKPRPMPVWLTPEEEQDRREGPPGPGRRMKRAVKSSLGEFAGSFRPPGSERPGRTAQEKAQGRESGLGGRAGWSKRSFAFNALWLR